MRNTGSIITILLALVLMIGAVPVNENGVSVYAAQADSAISGKEFRCGDHAVWDFNEQTGTLTISRTGNIYDYYDDDPWKKYSEDINKVVFDTGITAIGFTQINPGPVMYGDLNSDRKVDMIDLFILSRYLMREYKLSAQEIMAADVTGDGNTDIADLAMLKQYLMMDRVVLGPQHFLNSV